jgi:hypothetical protein
LRIVTENLTEFRNDLMLAPCSTEVLVKNSTRDVSIAIVLTVADAAAAICCGKILWPVLSGILWTRILIFLLAAVGALSLANIWARAIYSFRRRPRSGTMELSSTKAIAPGGLRGEGDV